jgi:hypothetical protein
MKISFWLLFLWCIKALAIFPRPPGFYRPISPFDNLKPKLHISLSLQGPSIYLDFLSSITAESVEVASGCVFR